MSDWINVVATKDLKNGNWCLIELDEDTTAMVINIDDQFYAIADLCTHDGGTLSDGDLEGCEIVCPRHAAHFDVRTGKVTAPPAYEDVPTFPTRVVEGMVQIKDDRD